MLSVLLLLAWCLRAASAAEPADAPSEEPPAEEAPAALSAEERYAAALAARDAGDVEEALSGLRSLVGDDPSRVSDDVRARARLAIGVLEYTLGDHEAAQGTLAALLATPRDLLPPQVWSEAKIYVAEIYYMEGREEAAEATLREVLERDIDTPIYPYEHIGDIVLRYQLLRDSIVADRQQAAAAPRPLPAWGYAPFGVPQFKQDRPVRGATYALLQVGFAATSVGSWALIARLERQYGGDHRSDTEEEQAVAQAEIERARVLRSGLSFPSAAAFYLTWGASVLDGGLAWRRQRRIEMGVGVLPAPDGLHVVMGGRF